jgi:oligopeptide/dipeptide ABC transporter ATP-binding protein
VSAILEVDELSKQFPVRRGLLLRHQGSVKAVDRVSLRLEEGECFAVVGESGSGKTTLARAIIRLIEPSSGRVRFRGHELLDLPPRELRRRRREFQMIFQDPYGSLNPRMTVRKILAEPIEVHRLVAKAEMPARLRELLDLVGMSAEALDRYPHEFSGGQRQRIGIARALATEPSLLLADEPVSALDVSVRAQIINLLVGLQRRLGLTLLVIAHDLAVVEQIADRVGVMYLGRLVEVGKTREIFSRPRHPYTVSLLSAIPVPDPASGRQRILLPGEPPSPIDPPTGCAFHPRCPIARERCGLDEPDLQEHDGWPVSCHYPDEMRAP